MSSIRCRALAAGATVVVMAATAGPAFASAGPVVNAIKAQDRALEASGALGNFNANTPAQAKQDLPKVRLLARKLDHAAEVVSHVKATTSTEKQGQQDWVTGVRDIATGFDQFAVAFKDLEAGNKTAEKAAALRGRASINTGSALTKKAQKLLGFS